MAAVAAVLAHGLDEEDMVVDETVGYPRAYAKLCRDRGQFGICSYGPPFAFIPYTMQHDEIVKCKEMEQMFPVIDPKARPTAKPRIFVSLLWKQLSHLGNAGFDPAVIRVDPYGNVLYLHADKASPLAWDIDHWFPCPRGGLTVPSNLRILQWQVCKRKHHKLEFLVPWWDLQLGISVNQFLSIFASSNFDFRHRAFSFLFLDGEAEELNDSQMVESHSFPHHFLESKEQHGLAPAAVVACKREFYDTSSALKSLDYNRQIRQHSPPIAARKIKPQAMKENKNPDFVSNPYQAIVLARDSLKQREENQKMQNEIQKLDEEVNGLTRKNEEEKIAIQDLELTLIKRRRRAEKCRKLAEAQSSYRTMLEKMIRDAMHQSVVYKEQVRLNQAASNALMARLEAQRAICDASEKELHKKFKQRDELEKQIRPEWEQARKRSRMDDTLHEDRSDKTVLYLPGTRPRTPLHKELRVFLEEEQKASEANLSGNEDAKHGEIEEEAKNSTSFDHDEPNRSVVALGTESPLAKRIQALGLGEHQIQSPERREQEQEEDEESRKQRGKGNVERWLQMLLENSQEDAEPEQEQEATNSKDIITKLNEKFPQKEAKSPGQFHSEPQQQQPAQDKGKAKIVEEIYEKEPPYKTPKRNGNEQFLDGEGKERKEGRKEKGLARSESARILRRIPSSPSIILGMKKGVECMRKKAIVTSDDELDDRWFVKSSMRSTKKAMKL